MSSEHATHDASSAETSGSAGPDRSATPGSSASPGPAVPPGAAPWRAPGSGPRPGRAGRVLSGVLVAVGCLLLVGGFATGAVLYRAYSVPTQSMAPTIQPGDRLLAERIDGSAVRRGDVVIFQDPAWGGLPEVKRVIGVGGDHIVCCTAAGRLTVDGKPITEPYLKGKGPASFSKFSATVPAGHLFLAGDNRDVSADSRLRLSDSADGSVPRSDVRARVEARAWPLGRFGSVPRTDAFAALPGGLPGRGPLGWIGWSMLAGAVLILGGAGSGAVAARIGRRRARAGG